ncbi:MAG: NUDIX hydrolase [Thermoguttaceae bacterium]|jgi:8-oxo-dGTP pyrophosphatase MutT (NUDIX family)
MKTDGVEKWGAVIVAAHPNDKEKEVLRRRYLVIRRSDRVIAPRRLCFPGGEIKPGETAEEAAKREFFEEIGGQVADLRRVWENITPWHVHLDWFRADLLGSAESLRFDPTEVEEILWMTLVALVDDPDALESNAPFLRNILTDPAWREKMF